MGKSTIRAEMRRVNRAVPEQQREEVSASLFKRVESLEVFNQARNIAMFSSLRDEVSTQATIERWSAMGKQILLPRVEVGEQPLMEFFPIDGVMMECGAFGISEPDGGACVASESIDLMIVPGVAFCEDGRRLGRGKGYYDHYLARCRDTLYKIGVCYEHQLLEDIPCEPHDVPMDLVIF